MNGHRIDWENSCRCVRCGAGHDDALDWKPCVDGIMGSLVDGLLSLKDDKRPTPPILEGRRR